MKQCIEECVKVSGCRVGEQCDAFCSSFVTQLPHLIPGLRNGPAFFLKQGCVVEQTAGAVEHGHQISFSVTIGIGDGVLGKSGKDLISNLFIFSRNSHFQNVCHLKYVVVLYEGLGQSLLRTNGTHDYVGIVACFHIRGNDIFQLLVNDQVNLNAGLLGKCLCNRLPHCFSVSGLNSCHGDRVGILCFVVRCLVIAFAVCASAAGCKAECHYSCQSQTQNFFEFHTVTPPFD